MHFHTQGRLFSHIRDACCYLVCVLSFRHHLLSLHRRPLLFRQQHSLSLSLLRRSLARSVCSDVPTGLSRSPPPAARALRIAFSFSPQKADAVAGRPRVCDDERGQSGCRPRRPPRCRRGRDAASDPFPRPCSPRRMSSSRYGGN
jgi:hypothetical protein